MNGGQNYFGSASNISQSDRLRDLSTRAALQRFASLPLCARQQPPYVRLAYVAGLMFWFTQKKFPGSYFALISKSRL